VASGVRPMWIPHSRASLRPKRAARVSLDKSESGDRTETWSRRGQLELAGGVGGRWGSRMGRQVKSLDSLVLYMPRVAV